MSAIFGLLRICLAHPASHRALSETEADWRHEAEASQSRHGRSLAAMRAILASARICIGSAGREFKSVPVTHLVWRLGAFGLPITIGLLWARGAGLIGYWGQFDWQFALTVTLLLSPQAALVTLPVVWFYAVGWPSRHRLPVMAVMTVAALCTFVLFGWMVPGANNAFRRLMYSMLMAQRGEVGGIVPGVAHENMLEALLSEGQPDMSFVATGVTLALFAATTVCLADRVARLRFRARVTAWIAFPVLLFAAATVIASLRFVSAALGRPPSWLTPAEIALLSVAQIALAIRIHRRSVLKTEYPA